MLGGMFGNSGGMVANSFYSSYVGDDVPIRKVVRGFPEELIDRLIAHNGASGYVALDPKLNPYHRPYLVIVDHEIPKSILGLMMKEAGVRVFQHTLLCGVRAENNTVSSVIIENKSGRQAILTKMAIDCTGDGDLAIPAGAQWRPSHNYIIGNTGFPFGMANIDFKHFYQFASDAKVIIEADSWHNGGEPKDGITRLKIDFRRDPVLNEKLASKGFGGMFLISIHGNAATYINMLGRGGVNIHDTEKMTDAEIDLRVMAMRAAEAFKENLAGFENSYLNWTAQTLGIRASRTLLCDYSITNDDIVESVRFNDEIGVFGFQDYAPIGEKWVMRNKGAYGLPYRMLLPRGLDNVWAAGRHITEDHEAHMSTRNTMCCMVQGQAAGVAAALCAANRHTSRTLPYPILRETLLDANVYLGE
jgi:hypothetical protein